MKSLLLVADPLTLWKHIAMSMFRSFLAAVALGAATGDARENSALPPYTWPERPKFDLWVDHQPLKGWRIETVAPGKGAVFLNARGREAHARGMTSRQNRAFKGTDESIYLLHFDYRDYLRQGGVRIAALDHQPGRPVFLGWDYHDFSDRLHRGTGERGFARNFIVPSEFRCRHGAIALDVPGFRVEPECAEADWQRFLKPTVIAEGKGNYLVVNGFDRAGMTVGFMQLAAHTPDDLIPLLKHLIRDEELRRCRYAHPQRWFPELVIRSDGVLGYRAGNRVFSLEEVTSTRNGNAGFGEWAYFREDFVRFCNPCVKSIDRSELEFAARWLMWSLSPKMRRAQLEPAKDSIVASLQKLDKAPAKVSGADAAVAAVVLHWRNGAEYRAVVSRLLREPCAVRSFLGWSSERTRNKWWSRISSSDRKILGQRVAAVQELFERDPELLRRLRSLTFDFRSGQLSG